MTTDDALKAHYGAAARRAAAGATVIENCGTPTMGSGLYRPDELALLPDEAVAGSGGGIDVLLSARRVGPTGRAYGVDMTPEMLDLARANQAKAGVTNAEFLEGHIEKVPLPDDSVDVVVSNCVINLSADKTAVFAEAHRVLRTRGRFAVADVVVDREPDPDLVADDAAWAACIAGALTRDAYRGQLETVGFTDVEITDSHEVADGFWSVFVRATKPPQ